MFPDVSTPDAWKAARTNDAALRPGVDAIRARHGLGAAPLRRYATGSVPVYAIGSEQVLKLFPPTARDFAFIEEQALGAVADRLPIATPELVVVGELEGWSYLLMRQLEGRLLSEAWPEVPESDRDRFAVELGETMAALHGVETERLDRLHNEWPRFLAAQRDSAVERQRSRGLGDVWLEQIPDFLATWMPRLLDRRALLHTELMREHLLVAPSSEGWRLTGLFDFEPATVGDAEYDLASFGVFVSAGDRRFLSRTLRAYGSVPDENLARRVLTYAILHRYSNLRWYLERVPIANDRRNFDALAEHWYGCQP